MTHATTRRAAAERHCDLMRQGCMKVTAVAPYTPAQVEAGKRVAVRILDRLRATGERVAAQSLANRIAWHRDMIARTTDGDTLAYLDRSLARLNGVR